MRGLENVAAVIVLLVLSVLAAVAVSLVVAGHAAPRGAEALPSLVTLVRGEAAEAYVVRGYGTIIGVYLRNVGDRPVDIKWLVDRGIAVYVYGPGGLVAANTSAVVAWEARRDGVWSPGELVVVEAVLNESLEPRGYRVVVSAGGSTLATLPLPASDVHVVASAEKICYYVPAAGQSITLSYTRLTSYYSAGGLPSARVTIGAVVLRNETLYDSVDVYTLASITALTSIYGADVLLSTNTLLQDTSTASASLRTSTVITYLYPTRLTIRPPSYSTATSYGLHNITVVYQPTTVNGQAAYEVQVYIDGSLVQDATAPLNTTLPPTAWRGIYGLTATATTTYATGSTGIAYITYSVDGATCTWRPGAATTCPLLAIPPGRTICTLIYTGASFTPPWRRLH